MLFTTSTTSSPSEGVVDGVHSNARRLYTSRPKPPGDEQEEDERDDDGDQDENCPRAVNVALLRPGIPICQKEKFMIWYEMIAGRCQSVNAYICDCIYIYI